MIIFRISYAFERKKICRIFIVDIHNIHNTHYQILLDQGKGYKNCKIIWLINNLKVLDGSQSSLKLTTRLDRSKTIYTYLISVFAL